MTPEKKLLISIKNTNTTHTIDLADKFGEVALDAILSDGVLKDIPVIGTALSLLKAGNGIAGYFFAKKIVVFLTEIEKVSSKKRIDFVDKECNDEEKLQHVGETTLMLLEKIDNFTLAQLLGRAFALMIDGTINHQTFEIYSYIIKNLDPYLIRQIKQYYQIEDIMMIDAPAATHLSIYGLINVSILPNYSGNTQTIQHRHEKTKFGEFFYKNIIEKE